MTETYELRSVRGNRPVFAYQSLARAQEERERARKRGIPLRLLRVTRIEEEID